MYVSSVLIIFQEMEALTKISSPVMCRTAKVAGKEKSIPCLRTVGRDSNVDQMLQAMILSSALLHLQLIVRGSSKPSMQTDRCLGPVQKKYQP